MTKGSTMVVEPKGSRPRPTDHRVRQRCQNGQRGSAARVVLAALVLCVAMLYGVSRLGSAVIALQRAQSVADLVALAGVTEGRAAASEVAGANAATLEHWGVDAGVVSVQVRRDGVVAGAAAT